MTEFDRATRRYFQLLESLEQAVIATDAAGCIIYWGHSATEQYGWSPGEVMGRDILEVTPSGAAPDELNALHLLLPLQQA